MLDLERKIEKTIFKAALALDENNWSGWFELVMKPSLTRSPLLAQK